MGTYWEKELLTKLDLKLKGIWYPVVSLWNAEEVTINKSILPP